MQYSFAVSRFLLPPVFPESMQSLYWFFCLFKKSCDILNVQNSPYCEGRWRFGCRKIHLQDELRDWRDIWRTGWLNLLYNSACIWLKCRCTWRLRVIPYFYKISPKYTQNMQNTHYTIYSCVLRRFFGEQCKVSSLSISTFFGCFLYRIDCMERYEKSFYCIMNHARHTCTHAINSSWKHVDFFLRLLHCCCTHSFLLFLVDRQAQKYYSHREKIVLFVVLPSRRSFGWSPAFSITSSFMLNLFIHNICTYYLHIFTRFHFLDEHITS